MKSTRRKKKKNDVVYGKTDLLGADAFSLRETKFRVTMFIDLDVLDEVRKRARKAGLPYQTYINQFLREAHLGSDETERIRRIVKEELAKHNR